MRECFAEGASAKPLEISDSLCASPTAQSETATRDYDRDGTCYDGPLGARSRVGSNSPRSLRIG